MKKLRLFYLVLLILSVSLCFVFYGQYQLKNKETAEYRKLRSYTDRAVQKISAQLVEKQKELADSRQEIARLNETVLSLERDKSRFGQEIEALLLEKQALSKKVALLSDEKLALEARLFSLKELKKAIKVARKHYYEQLRQQRIARREAKIEMLKKLDELALEHGNRGFLVRNGEITFRSARVRVELEPLEGMPSQ